MPSPLLSTTASDPAGPAAAAAKPILMVVDDEDGPRQSLRMVFRNDFNVQTFDDLAKAVAFARENTVSVAILDIRMAGFTGIEVLAALKQTDPKIEVIMLTAYETLDTARQALRHGACDYLSKPFDLATMREAVARALRLNKISTGLVSTSDRLREITSRLSDVALREEVARTTNEIYAGVLHDLNNPLTVISCYVEMLENRLKNSTHLQGEPLAKLREEVGSVGKQVNTCIAIASRYLRFIHQRNTSTTYQPVNQTLEDLHSLLKVHHSAKTHRLAFQPLPIDAEPFIDATDLTQILLNLSINALQSASRSQTVTITAVRIDGAPALPDAPVPGREVLVGREEFAPAKAHIAFTITDQGDGIPAEVLPKIFDPYFTTKLNRGTGLGLAIVTRLVLTHHGLIHLKTSPGAGTSVTVYLPLKD